MAKSYEALQQQLGKVRSAFERVTPPIPDDEFEDLRRSALTSMAKVDAYVSGRVTGDGSVQTPTAAE